MTQLKVLFVATSNDRVGDTICPTGVWLEEIAAPYYIFKDAGADLTLASPKGGEIPVDPKSLSIMVATSLTKRFLKDEDAMQFLSQSKLLGEIYTSEFDLIYVTGGLGTLCDLSNNTILNQLLEKQNSQNKLIGMVGHGVVALLSLQDANGEPLVKGKKVTGCSNTEEVSGGRAEHMPFLLESELIFLGALYSKNDNYVDHVVADGNIVTGQNPASSEGVAKKILRVLDDRKYMLSHQPAIST